MEPVFGPRRPPVPVNPLKKGLLGHDRQLGPNTPAPVCGIKYSRRPSPPPLNTAAWFPPPSGSSSITQPPCVTGRSPATSVFHGSYPGQGEESSRSTSDFGAPSDVVAIFPNPGSLDPV